MSSLSDELLIDKFLSATLSAEEEALFINRKEDETFNVKLEEAIVRQLGRQQLKGKLKEIGASQKPIISLNIKNKYKSLTAIAAMLILLVSIAYLLSDNTLTNDELFNLYYEPYLNVYAVKGDDSDNKTMLDDALQLYDAERYEEAVSAFAKIIVDHKNDNSVLFYYGQALLAIGNTSASQNQFLQIGEEYPLYMDAQWYIGLIYLKSNNTSDARTVYKNIYNKVGAKKQKQIKRILKEINK